MIIAESARRLWWVAAIAAFVIAVVVYKSAQRPSRLRPINYSVSLASSRDYWNYALAILPAANAGNADAQFYLWKVIDFCGQPYNKWFEDASKPGRLMTLDGAMQEAASQNAALDIVQLCGIDAIDFESWTQASWATKWIGWLELPKPGSPLRKPRLRD